VRVSELASLVDLADHFHGAEAEADSMGIEEVTNRARRLRVSLPLLLFPHRPYRTPV
jgi:hypothetical protein